MTLGEELDLRRGHQAGGWTVPDRPGISKLARQSPEPP